MLFLKYFAWVGTVLSSLLYGWCEYLGPSAPTMRAGPSPARTAEVFHPTPAPPIAAVEQSQPVEAAAKYTEHEKSSKRTSQTAKIARAQMRKPKTHVGGWQRHIPANSNAYARSEQSFFPTRLPAAATMRNDRWIAQEMWGVRSDSSRSRAARRHF